MFLNKCQFVLLPPLVLAALLVGIMGASSIAYAVEEDPEPFSSFPAIRYTGRLSAPKNITQISASEWRNEFGKMVNPVEINFAGKYYVSLNSCGGGCAYYEMTDLVTGENVGTLAGFASGEDGPRASDGSLVVTRLLFTPTSNAIVAQYHFGKDGNNKCSQRLFILERQKIKPIAATRQGCTDFK